MTSSLHVQTVVVRLVPGSPELEVCLEAPAGTATVRWVKHELCRQDPTGEAAPDDFRLCAESAPGKALPDDVIISESTGVLVVMADDGDAAQEAEQEEARLRAQGEGAGERARQEEARLRVQAEAEERAKEGEEEARLRAQAEAEQRERQEAKGKALEFFAQRKAKEEAEQKAKQEEAEQRARQQEEAEREAEEAEQQRRQASERASQEEAERVAQEEAERQAKEKAEREAQESKEEGESVLQKARRAAMEGAQPGVATVQVAFKYKGQAWMRHFEVDRGCLVLDLKEKMMSKAPEEAAWVELQRAGRRISDLEPIREDASFVFCFLGREKGVRMAARDVEQKAAEQAAAEVAAFQQAEAGQDVTLEVLMKKGVWEERRLTVVVSAGATAAELREAVAKSTGEDPSRIALFQDADTPEPLPDGESIGERHEFRARYSAPEGQQASPAELWQAADDLKWFAWHEIWHAAYSGFASKLHGDQKSGLLRQAEQDTKMSSKHYQAIEEAKAVPARLLRRLRQEAEASGQMAATALQEERELDPGELKTLEPPRDTDVELWNSMAEAIHVAAAEVVWMLREHRRENKISNTNFHPAWQKVVGRLCGSVMSAAGKEPLATLPLVLGTELKWFVWNDVWRAANEEFGSGTGGPKRAEKLAKAKEDGKRAEAHFLAVKDMGNFSEEALDCIRQLLQVAGAAAGRAALSERSLLRNDVEATPPPDELEVGRAFWTSFVAAVFECAACVCGQSGEGVLGYSRGRMHQVDFEAALRRLCDPPFVGEGPESNELVTAVLRPSQLERLPHNSLEQYNRDWVVGPLRLFDATSVKATNEDLARFLKRDLKGNYDRLYCTHVLAPWMHKIASHPKLVGAAASVLKTNNVLLYSSTLQLADRDRPGLDEGDAHWHADAIPLIEGLGPLEHFVTIMVALTPCARASGPAEYAMGHGVPTRRVELQPGEFSLHHPALYYKQNRNGTRERRDILIFRYISSAVRDTFVELREGEQRDWVVLLSGQDLEGNFRLLLPPSRDSGPEELKRWEAVKTCRVRRFKRFH